MTSRANVHVTPDDAYLSLKMLARYSGLSVRTLRSHLTNGHRPLPSYRIGGKVLVRQSEFDAWATQFRVVRQTIDISAMADEFATGLR